MAHTRKRHLHEQERQIDYCTGSYLYLYWIYRYKGKGEGKVHPVIDHEDPEVEQRYKFTLSLTSALDWDG